MPFNKKLVLSLAVASTLVLSGCAATHVAISKRDLDVQTKMSATIFLDPVSADKRSVYVQVRNTSDQQGFDMEPVVVGAIRAKGYQIVNDPDQATYVLQANVLQVGKIDPSAAEAALRAGYGGAGGAMSGALAGAAAGGLTSPSGRGALAGALIGGAINLVANAAVKDVYYSVTTDIQIKERNRNGKTTTIQTESRLQQGTSGGTQTNYSDTTDWRAYQTRIVSTANKMNLELAEALPVLREGISRSVAGLF